MHSQNGASAQMLRLSSQFLSGRAYLIPQPGMPLQVLYVNLLPTPTSADADRLLVVDSDSAMALTLALDPTTKVIVHPQASLSLIVESDAQTLLQLATEGVYAAATLVVNNPASKILRAAPAATQTISVRVEAVKALVATGASSNLTVASDASAKLVVEDDASAPLEVEVG